MSHHEKMAWWTLGSGVLIWLFLLMRFTEAGRIVELPAGEALATYIQMVVLWIVASVVPAVFAAKRPEGTARDERDRAIDALGDRWEGYVVVIAINVLIVHVLTRAMYPERAPSVPIPDFSSTTAMIFALLTTLFLADAVKQAVVLWQYRR
jgi:membrane protease YdiL (CAAX protease family)